MVDTTSPQQASPLVFTPTPSRFASRDSPKIVKGLSPGFFSLPLPALLAGDGQLALCSGGVSFSIPSIMSTAPGHPGLSFGAGLNNGSGLRQGANQGYPPPPSNKPVLAQHSAPYQHYSPHQSQQSNYTQIYTTPNPSPVQHNVQNGSRSQQAQLPVPSSRPRATNHRQMPPQSNNTSLGYIPTTMPHAQQHLPQQPMNPQPMSQQSMGQPSMPQQTINQGSMNQQQMSQQAISQQAINHQQSMAQETSMMSQATPPHTHPVLTPQPPSQAQPQQTPQQPPPSTQLHADTSVQNHEAQHDDTMDVESIGESGEDGIDGKNGDNGTPFVPRTPMGAMMSAPPEGGSYPTLDAVHKAVLEYCTSVGYAIVIGRSKKTVPGLKKVLFVCDRAGKPPKRVSPEMRKRKTSSRKCDCQFGFFAIEQRTQWTVRYRPNAQHLTHNHGPSESPMLHPAARKLDSKMVATVKELKEQGACFPQAQCVASDAYHIYRHRGQPNAGNAASC